MKRLPMARALPAVLLVAVGLLGAAGAGACGGGAPDARYPVREAGCKVRQYPGEPGIPVDDLGTVGVDCAGAAAGGHCDRALLDAVCARGGDVAWGLGDNALTAARLVAHAAHSKRASQGPRERGCEVRDFEQVLPTGVENVGTVTAYCSPDDSRDVCLRELKDQVCLLGGDAVWQIEGPVPDGDRMRMRGRAVHTR